MLGAAFANPALVAATAALTASIATALHRCGCVEWREAQGWARCPGLVVVPMVYPCLELNSRKQSSQSQFLFRLRELNPF